MTNFAAWYESRRGFPPFPWMMRLAARLTDGRWPSQITLPTGAGKSEVALIWAWARSADIAQPRRLWIVSDRRVIVDQAFEGAKILENDGILVSRLRGGIARDMEPMLDLERDQVISSTVDQFGSRLLFRGYGASSRAWPIHAALAGTDTLVILDEAHLSPNAEDVFRRCQALGASIQVVSMTATPRGEEVPFVLEQEDWNHPVLGQRLEARRHVEPRKRGDLASVATEYLAAGHMRIAAVANTVASARKTFTMLREQVNGEEVDLYLLTGRQSPIDRDRILETLVPQLRSGAERPPRPIIAVTTQCIEAGADFDFDAMVSEACPIDALLQRLGRLDRLGSAKDSVCVVLKPLPDVPPYGRAPLAVWNWLTARAEAQKPRAPKTVNLGPQAWGVLAGDISEDMHSSAPQPVTLLRSHLRMLTRTSPRPAVEPDIDLLLHGPQRVAGAVTVVWRKVLDHLDPGELETLSDYFRLMPPDTLEGCPVPIGELQAWLEGQSAADSGDVEGARTYFDDRQATSQQKKTVLRWRGSEEGVAEIAATTLRPGDVVILPASAGGYDDHGWAPSSISPVTDHGATAGCFRSGEQVFDLIGVTPKEDPISALVEEDPTLGTLSSRIAWWDHGAVVRFQAPGRPIQDPFREIDLDEHQARVAVWAGSNARAHGLEGKIFELAGIHHDDGKADLRWQIAIYGGDPGRAISGRPLAKGRYVAGGLFNLPAGWRHERESARRLEASGILETLGQEDRDLLLWLVATHHGYGRPLWPDHGDEVWELAELQERLEQRIGPWNLAQHEAILRLADQTISREEAGTKR